MNLDDILQKFDRVEEEVLERLFALMRVKSISTDPAFARECSTAVKRLGAEFASLGFAVERVETKGHPALLARYHQDGDARRHFLFYGHYDVQPVAPLADWTHPPFEPEVINGLIHGRGASDDKGQLRTFIEAIRALIAELGALPFDLTVLIEGEEEIGSPHLANILQDKCADQSFDSVLVCDSPMWDENTPAINVRLRGMVSEEVVLTTGRREVHSGLYGGPARNAAQVMAMLLASLHADDGSVAVPGFYDTLTPVPDAIKQSLTRLQFDAANYLADLGQTEAAGEKNFSPLEQTWLRPTAEINGIEAGYTGAGIRTMVPNKAVAKISFRLVQGQDPQTIRAAFRSYLEAMLPADCTIGFANLGSALPVAVDTGSQDFATICAALEAEWDQPVALTGVGGSLPVAAMIQQVLGLDCMLVGFALPQDNIHAPNETYRLESFRRGIRSWIRILSALTSNTKD